MKRHTYCHIVLDFQEYKSCVNVAVKSTKYVVSYVNKSKYYGHRPSSWMISDKKSFSSLFVVVMSRVTITSFPWWHELISVSVVHPHEMHFYNFDKPKKCIKNPSIAVNQPLTSSILQIDLKLNRQKIQTKGDRDNRMVVHHHHTV